MMQLMEQATCRRRTA